MAPKDAGSDAVTFEVEDKDDDEDDDVPLNKGESRVKDGEFVDSWLDNHWEMDTLSPLFVSRDATSLSTATCDRAAF